MHCLEISLCDQCSHRSDQTCVIQSMLTSDFQAYSHYSNKNPFYGNVFKVSKPTHQHYQLKSLVDQPQDHWLILSGWYSTLTFSVVCSSFSKKNHPSWSWMLITPLKNSLLELNKNHPSEKEQEHHLNHPPPFLCSSHVVICAGSFFAQPIQLRSQLIKGVDIQKPT